MISSGEMLDSNHIQTFQSRLRGELLNREAPGFDQSRKIWNGMFDRRPELIVRCAGAADVRHSVLFAREHGIPVAVKAGGHSVAGYSSCEGGLLIDLGRMKGIRVDPARRTVSAQTGVTWGEFDRETTAFDLATTGGVISSTGIAGLTLGGGIGWLMGKHGLACDNLISADVVTAEGRLVTADSGQNGDLKQAEGDLRLLRTYGPPVADMVGVMPYTALQTMLDATAPYGIRSYWKAQFMRELTDEALNMLLAYAERKPTPQTMVILEHVHGAASRVPADQTAYGLRHDHCSLNIVTSWTDPREDEKCIAWTREFGEAMTPFGDGSVYVNYLGNEGETRVRSAY